MWKEMVHVRDQWKYSVYREYCTFIYLTSCLVLQFKSSAKEAPEIPKKNAESF